MYPVWGPDLENGWPWCHSLDTPEGLCRPPLCLWKWLLLPRKEAMEAKKKSIICSLDSGRGGCFSKIRYEWELEEEEREEMTFLYTSVTSEISASWHLRVCVVGLGGSTSGGELLHWGSWAHYTLGLCSGRAAKGNGVHYGTLAWIPGI